MLPAPSPTMQGAEGDIPAPFSKGEEEGEAFLWSCAFS